MTHFMGDRTKYLLWLVSAAGQSRPRTHLHQYKPSPTVESPDPRKSLRPFVDDYHKLSSQGKSSDLPLSLRRTGSSQQPLVPDDLCSSSIGTKLAIKHPLVQIVKDLLGDTDSFDGPFWGFGGLLWLRLSLLRLARDGQIVDSIQ
jgi:hypothetical protein